MEHEDLDRLLKSLTFPALVPRDTPLPDISVRTESEKRQTIRYFARMSGKVFRVKEFFMDWFYTGFPKSLMKTLADTYGPVEYRNDNNLRWFYGRNYKGNDSASLYHYGCTAEIECQEKASADEFGLLIKSLEFYPGVMGRFEGMSFKDRSFLASGGTGDWWEDRRISRMSWESVEDGEKFNFGYQALSADSTGMFRGADGSAHRILVLSSTYFQNAVWVDFIDSNSNIEHGSYNFRKGNGLFNYFEEAGYFLAGRVPEGPSALQEELDGSKITVAFSPGFSTEAVAEAHDRLKDLVEFAYRFF